MENPVVSDTDTLLFSFKAADALEHFNAVNMIKMNNDRVHTHTQSTSDQTGLARKNGWTLRH